MSAVNLFFGDAKMKRMCLLVLSLALLIGFYSEKAAAASTPITLADNLKFWFSSFSKDFKRVKSNDTFNTYTLFSDRALDSLSVTGLQVNSTVFPTLPADLQIALTRLKTDIQAIKDKRSDVDKLLGDLVKDMRTAANGTTPPSIANSQNLLVLCYAAVADGIISDKERQSITEAGAAVTGTVGLSPTLVASINADVSAILASIGVTKLDLDQLKSDLASISSIIKAMK
jgi:hypothetical protein